MRGLAFYEAGYLDVKGIRRVVIPFRRLLRRLLRPILLQLAGELHSLARRQDQLDRELKAELPSLTRRQDQLDRELKHLETELPSLARRQDQFDRELKAVLALGWDHVAVTRRLAVLEEHMEAVLAGGAARDWNSPGDGTVRPLIRYPGLDAERGREETEPVVGPQAKVG